MFDYSKDDIQNLLFRNTDVIVVASTKENSYRAIKRSKKFSGYIDEAGTYSDIIEKLWFHMHDNKNKITDDYQIFLPKIGEFNEQFSQKINLDIDGAAHAVHVYVCPIEEHEGDYIIIISDLGVAEVEREHAKDSKVKTIEDTYLFSMYVDLNKDLTSGLNVSEISDSDMHYDVKYSEWRMMIVNMIWPEDQALFLEKTDPEYLKTSLKPGKTLSFDCQMKNLEGEYIWVKLIFGRSETINDSDFRFVFMVQNMHEDFMQLFDRVKKLEQLASNDALTGVFNRGRIETELANAIGIFESGNNSLALMMFDIDYFKKINDNFGHVVGDEVLKEFVCRVDDVLKDYGVLLGRWGGEEFVGVCCGKDFDTVCEIAEHVRKSVADKAFEPIGTMTCSVGVAPVSKCDTVKSAIARVDEALYEAKSGGRNCVKAKNI